MNLNMAVVFRLKKRTRESDIWESFGGEDVETFIDAGQQIKGEIHYFFVDVSGTPNVNFRKISVRKTI